MGPARIVEERMPDARGARETDRRRLAWTLALTCALMVAEIAGGILSNSLALLSDAGHMLTDSFALGLALFAVTVAGRPAPSRITFGYHRIEILAALCNGVLLTLVALWLLYEAVTRFLEPRPVSGAVVIGVALVGLAGNLAALRIMRGCTRHNLNIRGATLHVLSDTLSSGAVVISGVIIHFTAWYRLDSILSMVIAVVIVAGAVRILRESVDVLLEATPAGIDLVGVASAIRTVEGVTEVHDLHIWSITSGMTALSGHVILDATTLSHSDHVLNRIKLLLRESYGIEHTTIQVESESYREVGEVHGAGGI